MKWTNLMLAIALLAAVVLYGVALHQHDVGADRAAMIMTQEQWNRIR